MKNWPLILWVAFFVMVIALMCLGFKIMKIYWRIGVLKIYLGWSLLLMLIWYINCIDAIDVHIHHYVVALITLTYICYQSILLTTIHGIFCGMLIEGATRWGYDSIWIYKNQILVLLANLK